MTMGTRWNCVPCMGMLPTSQFQTSYEKVRDSTDAQTLRMAPTAPDASELQDV